MFNATETLERQYLEEILVKLRGSLAVMEQKILDYSDSMIETKRFAWENAGQLDPVELAAYRIAINEESIFAELSLKERNMLKKLVASPYFGRVDFAEAGEADAQPYYVGIHSYNDPGDSRELIIDWRAPLSSIFYDYETGPAVYRAPEGTIHGDISAKRQYRIRNSQMEYMLESALNIGDDILQQELSKASDDKMKNIVATIQKEQNSVIRDETSKVLIIQGAAGSGKTSIALHRVAFLLYRNKTTLKSEDVLILSPNSVFGSYISNVLPELGEENIPQISFEELARQFLGRGQKFQTFAEQVADLIETPDDTEKIERIRYKARVEFVAELDAFLQECDDTLFRPEDFRIELFHITAKELQEEYERLHSLPVIRRLEKIAADRIAAYRREHEQPLSANAVRQIKERIVRMFPFKDAMGLYRHFFASRDLRHLLVPHGKGKLEFCDVFPLAYLSLGFIGKQHRYGDIRHLLVDEMQDYTPVQYAFLSKVFACRKTILGDSHQSVNPYTSTSMESIQPFFPECQCVELLKSYRSTIEIVRFAQQIRENKKLEPIERHGDEPLLTTCADEKGEFAHIADRVATFPDTGHHSLGIICKSQSLAERIHKALYKIHPDVHLITFGSEEFTDGVTIASAHMAKGLEFDSVIVPGCSDREYRTELDRSLLYIACTRAMHNLELTFHGTQSAIIPPATIWVQGSSFPLEKRK
ncbi:AAA family ATPase [Ruminococcaceae bacterium OttesenSCG-928-L11]|nr:AAA family ATPase [Ruminococcaceae bacterium OttesenSCG-928-L11]